MSADASSKLLEDLVAQQGIVSSEISLTPLETDLDHVVGPSHETRSLDGPDSIDIDGDLDMSTFLKKRQTSRVSDTSIQRRYDFRNRP